MRLLLVALFALFASAAAAQTTFPSHPVKIIEDVGTGGTYDHMQDSELVLGRCFDRLKHNGDVVGLSQRRRIAVNYQVIELSAYCSIDYLL
jgi:hypothetical protein